MVATDSAAMDVILNAEMGGSSDKYERTSMGCRRRRKKVKHTWREAPVVQRVVGLVFTTDEMFRELYCPLTIVYNTSPCT